MRILHNSGRLAGRISHGAPGRSLSLRRRVMDRARTLSALETAALAVIAAGVVLRLYDFWKVPGINGDEAWFGVQALNLVAGRPVEWRTPTGVLLSPVHLGPLWALHLVADPAPWLLRVPTILSSLLEIGATAWAAHLLLGRRAAFAAAMLSAALPLGLAYARFGWQPSHLGLWAALAVVAVLRRKLLIGVALYAFGLWIHPTDVFFAPFLVLVFAAAELSRGRRAWLRCAAGAAAFGAATLVLKLTTSGGYGFPTLGEVWSRATAPGEWLRQAAGIAHLFLGDATYRSLAGVWLPGPHWVWVAVFWASVVPLAVVGVRRLIRSRHLPGLAVVAGAVTAHLAFFLLAGPQKIEPLIERYGLCLVMPSLLAAVVLAFAPRPAGTMTTAAAVQGAEPGRPRVVARLSRDVAWSAMCVSLLAGFTACYLVEFARSGGRAAETFWTGPAEPKVAAVQRILREHRPGTSLVIVTDGWWTNWLTRYLTYGSPGVTVTDRLRGATLRDPGVDVFALGFADGPIGPFVSKLGGPEAFDRFVVPGYARANVVEVWHHRP